jgi:acyl carrier protein
LDTLPIKTFIKERFLEPEDLLPEDRQPLFTSGLIDSFGILELIQFLEEEYDVEIDTSEHEIIEFDSVAKLENLLNKLKG